MNKQIDELIERALREDIGDGDHTSLACIPESAQSSAQLLVKEKGILAGVEIAVKIFNRVDSHLTLDIKIQDGEAIERGDIVLIVTGSARSILSAERLVLNCMQRMSGIATYTAKLCKFIEDTDTRLLDTRKTSPGIRAIEKMAVKIGGGQNHRHGLYDMMLIKDNHIDFAGGVKNAIMRANEYLENRQLDLKIEVEARTLQELDEILETGKVHRIMLDNFSFKNLRTAVEKINGKYETEASGGITEVTIRDYANCGVDFISVGALTHSVKSLDLSLKAM